MGRYLYALLVCVLLLLVGVSLVWAGMERGSAAIDLTKTVGLNPAECAGSDSVTVPPGTQVTYCYQAENTGDVPFNFYDLFDSELGLLANDQPLVLNPGEITEVLVDVTIETTTVNTATWTAMTVIGGYAMDDSIPYSYEDISATGTPFALEDEEVGGPYPIGFTFDYYGTEYTGIYVSSNGFLTVGDMDTGCCQGMPMPDEGSPDGVIAGWWDDLDPERPGGALYYGSYGTAPNRMMVIQFSNIQHWPSGNPVTMQFKLFEGSNAIEVHYEAAPGDGFTAHSAGIENQTGTQGRQFHFGIEGLDPQTAVRYTPEEAITAADIDNATVFVLEPDIRIDPPSLSSTQPPEDTIVELLQISNRGLVDLEWDIMEDSSPGLSCDATGDILWLSLSPANGATAPDETSVVEVTFDSTGLLPAIYEAALCVNSNDYDQPLIIIEVTLTVVPGGAPHIALSPPTLESDVPQGEQVELPLEITNTGTLNLAWTLSEESVSGQRSPASLLWDNGPLVNCAGCGIGGADESVLQNLTLFMTTYGFAHQAADNYWVADDFEVSDPSGWSVDSANFFAYQTDSSTSSTITGINWMLFDGEPGDNGSVIASGSGLETTEWANIYRVSESTTGSATDRPVMVNTTSMDIFLAPGVYWLAWQSDGTLPAGPFAPPITINGQATTGNGLQSLDGGATWDEARDGGPAVQQGLPFQLFGGIGGADPCQPADITWVAADPDEGATPPGETETSLVTFDAAGLLTGTYTGTLCVESNDPVAPIMRVPLIMTVTETIEPTPAIAVTKTVGLDPANCALSNLLLVGQSNTDVTYCYAVRNTGNISLTTHEVYDDKLGLLLSGPELLQPGATYWFTKTTNIAEAVTNVVTWTASTEAGQMASATASATVTEAPTDVGLSAFRGGSAGTRWWLPVAVLAGAATFFWVRRRRP